MNSLKTQKNQKDVRVIFKVYDPSTRRLNVLMCAIVHSEMMSMLAAQAAALVLDADLVAELRTLYFWRPSQLADHCSHTQVQAVFLEASWAIRWSRHLR